MGYRMSKFYRVVSGDGRVQLIKEAAKSNVSRGMDVPCTAVAPILLR